MESIKICIVLPHLRTGGGQQLAIDEAIGLKNKGLNVTLISLACREDNIFTHKAEEHSVRTIYLGKKDGHSVKTLFELTKLLIKEKPDVVHTHLLALPYTILAAFVMRKTRFFHTIHSLADKEAQLMMGTSRILFKCRIVTPIAISDYCKKSIVDYYSLDPKQIPVIYNGVDLSRFKCIQEYDDRTDSLLRIITTGRFEPVKNHLFMINVVSELIKKYSIEFVLLGDGELRPYIEKQIEELGLKDNIHLLGVTKNVEYELNKAHIYLMCSKYEGLPLSVIEAIACGLPVVATKAGGTVDIISKENGILCDIDDEKQVVDALSKLIESKDLRRQLSSGALRSAQKFDLEQCVTQYHKLFVKGVL